MLMKRVFCFRLSAKCGKIMARFVPVFLVSLI